MSTQLRISHALAISVMALSFTISAQASANRTFVSTSGSDSNTSSNCGATTPCRTFAAAISVLNAGGEIVVLTSGGYGPFTITQAVKISAIGVDASITATSGTAITVNTTGNVTIDPLNVYGGGTGNIGIAVDGAGNVYVADVIVQGFTGPGFVVNGSANVQIVNSTFIDDGIGVQQNNAGAFTFLQNSALFGNNTGFDDEAGLAAVFASSFVNNGTALSVGNLTSTAIAKLNHLNIFKNTTGIAVGPLALGELANSSVGFNTTAFRVASGGSLVGTIPGTNNVDPDQTDHMLMTPGIPLQ